MSFEKCTFLFGAGADSQFGLKTGNLFNKALLTAAYQKERLELLGNDFGAYQVLYSNSTKIFVQTIVENKEKASEVLGKEVVDIFIKYYNATDNKSKYNVIRDKCNTWIPRLNSKQEDDKIVRFFLDHAVFFDTLDEKFNALRKGTLDTRGKRVLNAYATIFILMINDLYNTDNIIWSYENVCNLLLTPPNKLCAPKKSYYETIKTSGIKCNIATTNYTDIVQNITQNDVAYLHGNLKWFEDYQKLTIYDCTNENELEAIKHSKTLMPFILIPSGVKPIICAKQIREFNKFIEQLDNSKYLCVVGYKFNSEDNHINSIIGDWLRNEDNHLIFLNYNDEMNWGKCTWAKDFTRSDYDFSDQIDYTSKIINIKTNSDNTQAIFDNVVHYLSSKQ